MAVIPLSISGDLRYLKLIVILELGEHMYVLCDFPNVVVWAKDVAASHVISPHQNIWEDTENLHVFTQCQYDG